MLSRARWAAVGCTGVPQRRRPPLPPPDLHQGLRQCACAPLRHWGPSQGPQRGGHAASGRRATHGRAPACRLKDSQRLAVRRASWHHPPQVRSLVLALPRRRVSSSLARAAPSPYAPPCARLCGSFSLDARGRSCRRHPLRHSRLGGPGPRPLWSHRVPLNNESIYNEPGNAGLMPTSLTAPRIVQTWCQLNALCVPCRRHGCGLAKGVPLCEPFGNLAGNLNHVILPVPASPLGTTARRWQQARLLGVLHHPRRC